MVAEDGEEEGGTGEEEKRNSLLGAVDAVDGQSGRAATSFAEPVQPAGLPERRLCVSCGCRLSFCVYDPKIRVLNTPNRPQMHCIMATSSEGSARFQDPAASRAA